MASWIQVGLRLKPSVHRDLKSKARKEGDVPLNRYITTILEAHLAVKEQDARTHTKAKG